MALITQNSIGQYITLHLGHYRQYTNEVCWWISVILISMVTHLQQQQLDICHKYISYTLSSKHLCLQPVRTILNVDKKDFIMTIYFCSKSMAGLKQILLGCSLISQVDKITIKSIFNKYFCMSDQPLILNFFWSFLQNFGSNDTVISEIFYRIFTKYLCNPTKE